MKFLYACLALVFIRAIMLYKTYHSVPLFELKRRARQDDGRAAKLYRVASYGQVLDLRQWLVCTGLGTVLLIWAAHTKWWLAAIASVVIAFLLVFPKFSADGWAGSLAALFAPFDARLLSILTPLLSLPSKLMPGRQAHTGLYEKRDLLEFIKSQNQQRDNRVSESDLLIAFNALQFADKQVRQVMTPRSKVKLVSGQEQAGPVLADELHKTGFARFPVVKDSAKAANPKIIGTLYLGQLIGYEGSAKVKDLANPDVYFINEDSNLHQALAAFLKTHHHLLIAVNSFEEMVGVITLEDILEQILGKRIADEFENYESLTAVAKEANHQPVKHRNLKTEPTEEPAAVN